VVPREERVSFGGREGKNRSNIFLSGAWKGECQDGGLIQYEKGSKKRGEGGKGLVGPVT